MKKGFAHKRPMLKPLSNTGLEAIKGTPLKYSKIQVLK